MDTIPKETIEFYNSVLGKLGDYVGGYIWGRENNVIYAEDDSWRMLLWEEAPDEVYLAFHINIDPEFIGNFTLEFTSLLKNSKIKIEIGQCYAQDANFNVVHGDKAYETVGRTRYDDDDGIDPNENEILNMTRKCSFATKCYWLGANRPILRRCSSDFD